MATPVTRTRPPVSRSVTSFMRTIESTYRGAC